MEREELGKGGFDPKNGIFFFPPPFKTQIKGISTLRSKRIKSVKIKANKVLGKG